MKSLAHAKRGSNSGDEIQVIHATPERISFMTSKITVDAESGCWIWNGCRTSNKSKWSYGRLHWGTKENGRQNMVLVHKAMYAITTGSVPQGMCILHTCDQTRCCNPAHLKLGTHQDNMDDRDKKRRGWIPPIPPLQKLTWELVRDIRRRAIVGHGGNVTALAKEFSISTGQARAIIRNAVWKE